MDNILIAVDGSEGGRRAAEVGVDLAARIGASVVLVCVVRSDDAWVLSQSVPRSGGEEQDLRETVAEAVDRDVFADTVGLCREQNVPFTTKVLYGSAAKKIVEEALALDASLVVIGHRGVGGVGRFFMGSTSYKVSHMAPCPVMVVPEKDRTLFEGKTGEHKIWKNFPEP